MKLFAVDSGHVHNSWWFQVPLTGSRLPLWHKEADVACIHASFGCFTQNIGHIVSPNSLLVKRPPYTWENRFDSEEQCGCARTWEGDVITGAVRSRE